MCVCVCDTSCGTTWAVIQAKLMQIEALTVLYFTAGRCNQGVFIGFPSHAIIFWGRYFGVSLGKEVTQGREARAEIAPQWSVRVYL